MFKLLWSTTSSYFFSSLISPVFTREYGSHMSSSPSYGVPVRKICIASSETTLPAPSPTPVLEPFAGPERGFYILSSILLKVAVLSCCFAFGTDRNCDEL